MALGVAGMLAASAGHAADIVVIVHPEAPAPTRQQVSDIYRGRRRTYSPVDLAETSPIP